MSNNLTKAAREILAIEADLPYRIRYEKSNRSNENDFEMYVFPQVWGSTALGFGGVGGQMMTTANTYVFIDKYSEQNCFVYFGGRFAYEAPYCQEFIDDVRRNKMEPVNRKGKYKTRT